MGVAGVETKRHEVTGEVVFLEANVRIPTQWGLGDIAGGESSWRLYSVLAGLPVAPSPRFGTAPGWSSPSWRYMPRSATSRAGERPPLSLRDRLRGWRGAWDRGLVDLDDPGPALALARRALGDRLAGFGQARQLAS